MNVRRAMTCVYSCHVFGRPEVPCGVWQGILLRADPSFFAASPQINELHLQQYFAPIGMVTAVRVAGDMTAPTRMAWVEFATMESAQLALAYDGQARTL